MHIKANINESLYYNIRWIEPIKKALKQNEVGKSVTTIIIEICDNAVQSQHNTTKKEIKQWKSRLSNTVRLHLKHIKGEYSVCNTTESLIE